MEKLRRYTVFQIANAWNAMSEKEKREDESQFVHISDLAERRKQAREAVAAIFNEYDDRYMTVPSVDNLRREIADRILDICFDEETAKEARHE